MSIFSGSTAIKDVYSGIDAVKSVYAGQSLVWEKSEPGPTFTGLVFFKDDGTYEEFDGTEFSQPVRIAVGENSTALNAPFSTRGLNKNNVTAIVDYGNVLTAVADYSLIQFNSMTCLNVPALKTAGRQALDLMNYIQEYDFSSLQTIGNYGMRYFATLSPELTCLNLPSLKTTSQDSLHAAKNVKLIKVPELQTIGSRTFMLCGESAGALLSIDFSERTSTSIPSLASTSSMPSDYVVMVPASLYASWKSATNWSTLASHIVAV